MDQRHKANVLALVHKPETGCCCSHGLFVLARHEVEQNSNKVIHNVQKHCVEAAVFKS